MNIDNFIHEWDRIKMYDDEIKLYISNSFIYVTKFYIDSGGNYIFVLNNAIIGKIDIKNIKRLEWW